MNAYKVELDTYRETWNGNDQYDGIKAFEIKAGRSRAKSTKTILEPR